MWMDPLKVGRLLSLDQKIVKLFLYTKVTPFHFGSTFFSKKSPPMEILFLLTVRFQIRIHHICLYEKNM